MMGHQTRSEALFYYFRLEDQVPENHLLRLIDKHVSFGFVRERLKDSYSDTGRPSILALPGKQEGRSAVLVNASVRGLPGMLRASESARATV